MALSSLNTNWIRGSYEADILIDSGRNWIIYNGRPIAGVFTDDGSGSTFVTTDGRTLAFRSPGQRSLSATDSVTFQNQTGAAAFTSGAFGLYLRGLAANLVPGLVVAGNDGCLNARPTHPAPPAPLPRAA